MMWGICYSRIHGCFFTASPAELTARFQYGTQKGLRDTPERVARIDSEYLALEPLRDLPEGNVLYWTTESSRYLEDKKQCASFSMWFWLNDGVDYNLARLEKYWSLFPEKRPDYIYLYAEQAEDPAVWSAFERYSYERKLLSQGVVLKMNWTK